MNQEIDPFTGLPLKTISATAPQRSANLFETPPILSSSEMTKLAPMPKVESSSGAGLPKTSLVEGILFGLTGAPDSDLSKEALAERNQDRAKAQQAANSAATGQGGSDYMQYGGGAGGGGSALESLGKLVKLFAGGGG